MDPLFEQTLTALLSNESKLAQMAENAGRFAVKDAEKVIYDEICRLVISK